MDARTIEIVRTLDVDFDEGKITVCPQDKNYRVGAGLYLMVPVSDSLDAKNLKASLEGRADLKETKP